MERRRTIRNLGARSNVEPEAQRIKLPNYGELHCPIITWRANENINVRDMGQSSVTVPERQLESEHQCT